MGGVAVRLKREHAQGGGDGIQLPGGIQRGEAEDPGGLRLLVNREGAKYAKGTK